MIDNKIIPNFQDLYKIFVLKNIFHFFYPDNHLQSSIIVIQWSGLRISNIKLLRAIIIA